MAIESVPVGFEKEPHDPELQKAPKHSPFGALLSRTLPNFSGTYHVGVCDVEAAVVPRLVGSFVPNKAASGSSPGFKLDTVLFTLFYPSEPATKSSKNVVWFPRLRQTIDGFLGMADRTSWLYRSVAYPIAAAAIWGTTFPAIKGAQLLTPPSASEQWPIAIFSHGVGCSRLMYSQICGSLAARGYIVAAIEHRDGTGPCSSVCTERGGKTEDIEFLRWKDVHWPELTTQPSDDTTLRHDQLKMRLIEMEETVRVLQGIVGPDGAAFRQSLISGGGDLSERWTSRAVNVSQVLLTGHSLGGSAVLAAAAEPDRFAASGCIAMDPAVQRLEPWTGSIGCPVLCVNSDEFADSDDFDRLLSLSKTVSASLAIFSIGGSTHPSFSDVFLIIPNWITKKTGMPCSAPLVFHQTFRVIERFFAGTVSSMISEVRSMQGRQKRPVGDTGELVAYV